MKPYASILLPILLGVFLGSGTAAPAQDLSRAEQFFGVPGGWTFEPDPPTVSTFVTSDDATGFILFFCDGTTPGFSVALSLTDEQAQRHDGLVQVFPALGQPGVFLLAQLPVRFHGDHAFRSMPFRSSETSQPKLLLDIIRDYPTGIRLNILQLRQDRFTPPRRVDLFLPQTSDDDGLPMEVALPLLEESCRVR
jgi:hypothetical protein